LLRIDVGVNTRQPLEANIGPHAINAEEQALLQEFGVERLTAASRLETVETACEQRGFLEHVKEIGHPPAADDLCFHARELLWLGLRWKWGERNPAFPAFCADDHIVGLFYHEAFKRGECRGQLGL